MSRSRGGRPVAVGGDRTVHGGLALAGASVAAIGMLAGCGTSSSSTSAAGTPAAAGASATASVMTSATVSVVASGTASATPSGSVGFVPITEPFDPGHPARTTSSPASCAGQQTTLAIEQCFENKAESADAVIDTLRQDSFASASGSQQAAINASDSAWLAARQKVCAYAYHTGGTIDGINVASCLADESTARLDSLKGITPPEAVLKSTDSTALNELSYYTTPGGTRIAMIDTQGDATGGAVIAWVIIAGSSGFTVNPAQFSYKDGTFTDAGVVQVAQGNPSGHKVAAGTEYQFSIDYSHLSSDPNAAKRAGGWVYSPGTPAAVWR